MDKRDEREDAYRHMLRAIMLRQGGSLRITPEEMTDEAYTIFWRRMDDGGLEAKLEDGDQMQ